MAQIQKIQAIRSQIKKQTRIKKLCKMNLKQKESLSY